LQIYVPPNESFWLEMIAFLKEKAKAEALFSKR